MDSNLSPTQRSSNQTASSLKCLRSSYFVSYGISNKFRACLCSLSKSVQTLTHFYGIFGHVIRTTTKPVRNVFTIVCDFMSLLETPAPIRCLNVLFDLTSHEADMNASVTEPPVYYMGGVCDLVNDVSLPWTIPERRKKVLFHVCDVTLFCNIFKDIFRAFAPVNIPNDHFGPFFAFLMPM